MGDRRSRTVVLALLALAGLLCVAVLVARASRGRARGDGGAAPDASARSGAAELSATELGTRAPAVVDPAPAAQAAESARAGAGPRAEAARAARLQVTGRVVDEAGAPIAEAEVLEWNRRGTTRVVARTDENGHFEGEILQDHWLHVYAAGFARAERPYSSRERGTLDLGTIVLAPGGDVHGRVREEGGRVPARALLVVSPAKSFPSEVDPGDVERATFGDDWFGSTSELAADGTFRLRGLPAGECFVWAETPGGHGWSPLFRVAAGDVVEVEVVVPRPDERAWISGRVSGADGMPLAEVQLTLRDTPGRETLGSWTSATSAPDGSFVLELDEPGVFTLRARDLEHRHGSLELAQVASGSRDLELVLPPLLWVEVRLVDERGAALAWGNVWGAGGDSEVPLTPLGERGIGRIPFAGRTLLLEADAPGYARKKFGPYAPADVERGLVLTLAPGGFVRGRLTSGGRAVKGARLDLSPAGEPGGALASRGTAPDGWPFALTNRLALGGDDGTSDGEGRFTLSIPNAGWHALSVVAEGFPLTVFGPWQLDPAHTSPALELELERGGALEGRVLLSPGEAPRGRYVGVSNGWNFAHTTAVQDDGSYRFASLAPGPWQVRPVEPPVASLQGLEFEWGGNRLEFEPDVEVRAGSTARHDLDCTFARGVSVSGRFAFEGVDLTGWRATLGIPANDGEIPVAVSELASDGTFRVSTWKPGRYVLGIACDESAFRQTVELLASETRVDLGCSAAWVEIVPTEPSAEDTRTVVKIGAQLPEGGSFSAWSGTCARSGWRVAVPAGRIEVLVHQRGVEEPVRSEPVDLLAGEERELALPRAPAGGR